MPPASEAAPWDVVVIGLGGVGSFALRSLVRRGDARNEEAGGARRILGLERFRAGHANGSSHGGTRVFRHAYFEHPDYVPLLRYSTDEFLRLEADAAESGGGGSEKLLERCGNLIVERRRPAAPPPSDGGDPGSRLDEGGGEAAGTGTPVIDACLRSAREHSVPVEFLERDELVRRFPQFEFDARHVGLFEPEGGFVRPEAAVTAAVEDAKRRGAEVREGVRVRSIEEREGRGGDGGEEGADDGAFVVIRLASEDGGAEEELLARKVVVAGGPWAGRLLPGWSPHLRVTRQVQAWIEVGPEDGSAPSSGHLPDAMPTWIRAPEPGDTLPPLYGFPTDPSSDHPNRIKIALHGRNEIVEDPDDPAQRRVDVTDSDLDELRTSATPFLRAAAVSSSNSNSDIFVDAKTCLYTVSSDEHFLLGQPAGFRLTYGAAGLSGHGFKMVPALGKALADLALDGETNMPIGFLSPSRFGV